MSSQFISFTALPAGAEGSKIRLTVFISPNLVPSSDRQLSSFPAFVAWPDVARQLRFKARFRTVDRKDLGGVDLPIPAIPSAGTAAWRKAFPPSLSVGGSGEEDTKNLNIAVPATYDLVGVRDAVRELYRLEVSPSDDALKASSLARRNELFDAIRRYEREDLEKGAKSPSIGVMKSGNRAAAAFRALQAFHLPSDELSKAKQDDEREFHALLSSAGQYPFLLRYLGLAIDFALPFDQVPSGDHELAIVPTGPAGALGPVTTTIVTPWTRYRHIVTGGLRSFAALGRTGKSDGFLELQDPKYAVALEDIDNAAYGAIDFVERTTAALKADRFSSVQDALPALRTKGVQLFNTAAASEIAQAQKRSAELVEAAKSAAAPFPPPADALAVAPVIFREDVVIGHRPDIKPTSGNWLSLCGRQSQTSLVPNVPTVNEEGYVCDALSDANAAANGAQDRSSQILVRWHGWSSVVPRPGAASTNEEKPTRVGGQSAVFNMQDRVPSGSLPSLRFGSSYEIRCREVDLAGNGPHISASAPSSASILSIRYLRYDPVLPPRIVGASEDGSTAHLILSKDQPGIARSARCTLLPPVTALDIADKHGVFDAMSHDASYRALLRTAVREEGGEGAGIVDPGFGGIVASCIWPPSDARIATVRAKTTLLDVDAKPFVVEATAGSYRLDSSGRTLKFQVPPAGAMRVRIASFIPENVRSRFENHGANLEPGTRAYDLIAPPVDIIAYHPVERPLERPSFGQADNQLSSPLSVEVRKAGDTHAVFKADDFAVHTESTGRFDVIGEWDEISDVPTGDIWPTKIRQRERLFGGEAPLPVGHPLADGGNQRSRRTDAFKHKMISPLLTPDIARYDFRDTKHRTLEVTAVGVSRFEDSFVKNPSDRPDRFTVSSQPSPALILNTRPPEPPRIAYIVPTLSRTRAKTSRKTRVQTTEGWGLRIYIVPGDWFESGDGVRLAALFSQPPSLGVLTQIAGDPIVDAAAVVNALTPADLLEARSEHANLRQVVSSSKSAAGPAPTQDANYEYVSASTFDVGWDAQKGLIYADIVLRIRKAYRPFVRLALARFQPNSIEGSHLSTTTFADFVQLTPERSLSITRSGRGLFLRIEGAFPRQSGPSKLRTTLSAIVEETSGDSNDSSLREIANVEFKLQKVTSDLEAAVWTAGIERSLLNGSRVRIVIQEWEDWGPSPAGAERRRLVYSDEIKL